MTEELNSGKPLSRREIRAAQRRQAAGEDPIVASPTQAESAPKAEPVYIKPDVPGEIRYRPGSAPKETFYYGEAPKFVASAQPETSSFSETEVDSDDLGADLPRFEVPRRSFLDSLLNGTFRAESLLSDSPLTESLIRETLGDEAFDLEAEDVVEAVSPAETEVEPEVDTVADEVLEQPAPRPASAVQEPPTQSIPIFKASVPEAEAPVDESASEQVTPEAQKPAAQAKAAADAPTRKSKKTEANDSDEGLFRIPTSLTGEIATASIVVENATNPLDIIANPTTQSIPLRTGSIDIQLPESRAKIATPKTDPIRVTAQSNSSAVAQVIAPMKAQTIALTGELGYQRGVNFKPIDTQKYWVLGTGLLMVVVGVATLVSFLMGYLH